MRNTNVYISLLRSINVAGHNIIKMPQLIEIAEKAGFSNISTYIQSGNLVFTSSIKETAAISKILSDEIQKSLGMNITVITFTLEEMEQIVNNNPFAKNKDAILKNLYITYLSEIPAMENVNLLKQVSLADEPIFITDKAIYIDYTNGYGNAKFTLTTIEKKLKLKATTRNLNTSNKLVEIAKSK